MATWRDELVEAVKSKAEREEEEREKHRKRVAEALATAEAALNLSTEALRFANEKLKEKQQTADLSETPDSCVLAFREQKLAVELNRETAVVKVTFGESKPREFDFAKDRHIAPTDVEEYMGRRALELVRTAYKSSPW